MSILHHMERSWVYGDSTGGEDKYMEPASDRNTMECRVESLEKLSPDDII